MTPAMVFTSRLFPLFAVDEAYLERAERLASEAAPVVRRTMLERADLVRRMLRSRARQPLDRDVWLSQAPSRTLGGYRDPVLEPSSLDIEGIATALADQTDYERRWLINPATGEIEFWTADCGIDGETPVDLDELDLTVIDPLPSYIWYQDMADFAEQIQDERAGRRLSRAIRGKGAFRRFKDELHEEYPHLLPVWHAFRDARAHRRAVTWLADNSLITHDAAAQYLAEHPEPDLS
jgi:hypothetical protein